MIIKISHLALEAIVAFGIDNLPRWLDRSNLALGGAGITGPATFLFTPQPVENTKPGNKTQARTKRA